MDTIINPENGESLYLYSREGLRVLDQYMIRYKGGADNTDVTGKDEGDAKDIVVEFKLVEMDNCKCGRQVFPEDGELQAYRLIPLYIKYCKEFDAIIEKTTLPEMEKRNSYVLPDILPKVKGDGTLYTKEEKDKKKVTNEWKNARYVALDKRRKTWYDLKRKMDDYLKSINDQRKRFFKDISIPKIINGKQSYTASTTKKALGLKTKYNMVDVDVYTIDLPDDWFQSKKKGLIQPKKGFILGDSHYNYKNALNNENKEFEFNFFNETTIPKNSRLPKDDVTKSVNCSVNSCDIGACPTTKNSENEKKIFETSTKKNIFIRNFCNLKSSVLCNDPKICTGCGVKEMGNFKKLMRGDKNESKQELQSIIKSLVLQIKYVSDKYGDVKDDDNVDDDDNVEEHGVYDYMYHLLNEKKNIDKTINWFEATIVDDEPNVTDMATRYIPDATPLNVVSPESKDAVVVSG